MIGLSNGSGTDSNFKYYEDLDEYTIAQIKSLGLGHLLKHRTEASSVATVQSKKKTLTPCEFVTPQPQYIPF